MSCFFGFGVIDILKKHKRECRDEGEKMNHEERARAVPMQSSSRLALLLAESQDLQTSCRSSKEGENTMKTDNEKGRSVN